MLIFEHSDWLKQIEEPIVGSAWTKDSMNAINKVTA